MRCSPRTSPMFESITNEHLFELFVFVTSLLCNNLLKNLLFNHCWMQKFNASFKSKDKISAIKLPLKKIRIYFEKSEWNRLFLIFKNTIYSARYLRETLYIKEAGLIIDFIKYLFFRTFLLRKPYYWKTQEKNFRSNQPKLTE